ncbi:heavy-metal-associated domain-containing protein [Pontimicrobium aquaticum]|uniref:Cation transporter n=1 Tax=Pontimicrobium aquaticum TaxID=2565367 RepID=A0A4U0F0S7_9FLAO|nr:heavy-metal-associated domain-containing protein [Pontimicrobium aquaticum]TJY38021.1 cation transporter [Pontimicrobium aquaticum]
MKTLKNTLVLVMAIALMTSCKNKTTPEVKTVKTEVAINTENVLNPDATFIKSEFTIDGMTCEMGCAKLIEKNISKMNGVKSVKVDFNKKLAMVEYDESMVNHSSLEATVTNSDETYKVSNMKIVNSFSNEDKEVKECGMGCCKGKTEAEKKEIKENCNKACCADEKAKA